MHKTKLADLLKIRDQQKLVVFVNNLSPQPPSDAVRGQKKIF